MSNIQYNPTSVSPPGATLRDILDEMGITQQALSIRLNRSDKNLSQIVNGKAPITPELAVDLERVLGTPARFWLERESRYREWLIRKNAPVPTEEDLAWARSFDYRTMAKYGWVSQTSDAGEKYQHLLIFFRVVDRGAYLAWTLNLSPQYRRSQAATDKDHLIAAWLRQGEIESQEIECANYDERKFVDAVAYARKLTCRTSPEEFVPDLKVRFAASGVILLFIPELPGMSVSGATRWITPTRALIQITLRYKTNDHLWFTIFHEACHILKHQKRAVYLETSGEKGQDELEADEFAANHLIPPSAYRRFINRGDFGQPAIEAFAKDIGIAAGIIIGRLQNNKYVDWHSPLNTLKISYQWTHNE